MKRNVKFWSCILVVVMAFGVISPYKAYAATYQEMLDAGLVELTSNVSLTLRAGETYYISLRGGDGGGGGSSIRFDQRNGSVSYTGGGGASRGGVNYYSVEVASDTVINLYTGGGGYRGQDCNYQFKNPPEWGSVSGGSGGSNALGMGNGSPGGNGVSYYSWDDTKAGRLYYGAGSGGGGGAASIITFGGNNNNRITAPGGYGGSSGYIYFYNYDGESRYYPDTPYGRGGAGGSASQNFASIPGVTVKQLSSAEGIARVKEPTNSGAVIRKQRKETGQVLSVKDLMVGEHIVLTNSVDNSSTTFRKTSNEYEFEYQGGRSSYYTGGSSTNYLSWMDFSKYAVSGAGASSSMKIIVKSDLTFVGGDGTAIRPYYPEPAGRIASEGGSSVEKSSEDIEALVNSIISVSSMVENLNNTLSAQGNNEIEDSTAKEFKPFDIKIKTLNGASATKQSSIQLHAGVTGRALSEIDYKVVINGQTVKDYASFPSDGIITVTGLLSGQNSIQIIIKDAEGNTSSDIINIWKVN